MAYTNILHNSIITPEERGWIDKMHINMKSPHTPSSVCAVLYIYSRKDERKMSVLWHFIFELKLNE